MIELYFQDTRVDLKENFNVLMTFESFDTANPSTVKNSFSKTITLPGTEKNNRLFGQLWNVNKVIYVGENSIGSNYNPHKKTDFYILNNGVLIESGYVELNSIVKSLGTIEYKVTLYGGIGSIFYNLNYTSTGNKKKLSDLWFRWNETKPSGIFQPYPTDEEVESMKYREANEILINKDFAEFGKILTHIVPTPITPINLYPNGDAFTDPFRIYLSEMSQDICPIPLYSGYYDNFDSKSMLVNYPVTNDVPYQRDKWGLEYDLLDTWNTLFPTTRTEDDKTYRLWHYDVNNVTGDFMKIEALRDLDPSEAHIYNIDELNWGIKFSKLMHTITDFENLSEDKKYVITISDSIQKSPYFKDTFLNLGKLYYAKQTSNKYVSATQIDLNYDNAFLGWNTPEKNTNIVIEDTKSENNFIFNISKNIKIDNYQHGAIDYHVFTGWKSDPGTHADGYSYYLTKKICNPENTIKGPYGYLSSYVRIHQDPAQTDPTNNVIDQYWYGQCNLIRCYNLNSQIIKTVLLVNYQAVVAESSDFNQRLGTDAYGNSQFEQLIADSGFTKPSYIVSDVNLTEAWILNDWYNQAISTYGGTIDEVQLVYTDNNDLHDLKISTENYQHNPASIGQLLVEYNINIKVNDYVSNIIVHSFNLYEKLPYEGWPEYGICEADMDYRHNWNYIKNRVFNILYSNGRWYTTNSGKINKWADSIDNGNKCIENMFYVSKNGQFSYYIPSQYDVIHGYNAQLEIYYNNGYRNNNRSSAKCGYLYIKQGCDVVNQSEITTSTGISKSNLLNNTESPYRYLIDAMKMFRWKLYDAGINKNNKHEFQLMTPGEYYMTDSDVFLEDNIDWSKSQELKHNVINVPYVNLRLKDTNDAYVQYLYEKKYSNEYDQKTFLYNYEFNNDSKDYLDVIYPSSSLYNNMSPYYNNGNSMPVQNNSDFKQTLYWNYLNQNETHEKQIFTNNQNTNLIFEDPYAKICSFDKDNNYTDSTMNALLFYSGIVNNIKRIRVENNLGPDYIANQFIVWPNLMLNSSNSVLFENMNNGDRTYIWDFNGNRYDSTKECFIGDFASSPLWLPFFSPVRYFEYNDVTKVWSPASGGSLYSLTMTNNDYISGNLTETPFVKTTQDVVNDVTGLRLNINKNSVNQFEILKNLEVPNTSVGGIYSRCYQAFMEDAYSDNAKKVTLWCQLPDIPKIAMRKFYIFDNSYWIILKIYDYDVTATNEQFIKVDFLQVQNKNNYVTYNG